MLLGGIKNMKEKITSALLVIGKGIATAGIIGVGGYFVCWGLNWLTARIMDALRYVGGYMRTNYVAMIIILVGLTIACILGELIFSKRRTSKRKSTKAKVEVKPDPTYFDD